MNLRKLSSIIFYVSAALLMAYAVWAFTHSANIISEALEAGQITIGGNLYDIIGFYMANTGQYFVFALLLAGVGILLHKNEKAVSQNTGGKYDSAKAQSDAELDEWFSESENSKEDE